MCRWVHCWTMTRTLNFPHDTKFSAFLPVAWYLILHFNFTTVQTVRFVAYVTGYSSYEYIKRICYKNKIKCLVTIFLRRIPSKVIKICSVTTKVTAKIKQGAVYFYLSQASEISRLPLRICAYCSIAKFCREPYNYNIILASMCFVHRRKI